MTDVAFVAKKLANAVLCKSCRNWIYGRYAKIKSVANRLVIDFKCTKCKGCLENVDPEDKLHDVETVTDFSYIGHRIYSGAGCVAAVTSRTRLGWIKFNEC